MPNAKRHPGIVPRVFSEDGDGHSRPAKCALCGDPISKNRMTWAGLPSDPDGVMRPLHTICAVEYRLYVQALGL